MAYSELIKKFDGIREYIREFYIYGLKSRQEFTGRSSRTYDDENRRAASWFGGYIDAKQDKARKNTFISIDSRTAKRNPLFRVWKTKSFTGNDITLHFILLDILYSPEVLLSIPEILMAADEYTDEACFTEPTVRRKLDELVKQGIVEAQKQGRVLYYHRTASEELPDTDMLTFFSETAPCGVVGSFLLDKAADAPVRISFKHHYLTGALDSEIMYELFAAMREKREVTLRDAKKNAPPVKMVPLKIMISVQSGRQYVMGYSEERNRMLRRRLDSIKSVKAGAVCGRFDDFRGMLEGMLPHMWGVSFQSDSGARMETVEFTIRYADDEAYIPNRLEREKRCGTVEHLDANHSRFTAEVYDAHEMLPWIRTFIMRIESIHFSNEALERRFRDDIAEMCAIYGLKGGEGDAV